MTIVKVLACGLVALTALLSFASSGLSQGGASTPSCNCTGDKKDLESRINQLNAVDKEFDRLIKEWSTPARKDVTLDDTIRENIKGSLNFVLGVAYTPGARVFGGNTPDGTCESTYDTKGTPTPCLKAGLIDHEAVHKKMCDAKKNTLGNWRYSQKVVEYLKEDQDAYRAEKAKLESEYNRLKASCQQFTQLDKYQLLQEKEALAQRERIQNSGNRLKFVAEALN